MNDRAPHAALDGPVGARLREYHERGVVTFREWQALDARFACGRSWAQIAAALTISREAAKSRVANGLRKILEHERSVAA